MKLNNEVFMSVFKGVSVFVLSLMMLACANVTTEPVGAAQAVVTPMDEERANIEQQIARITEKLKDKPTVKGWVLVGDGQMHLKKYDDAVWAYREAYILSKYADGPRRKLKRAMYLSSLELNNQNSDDK